MSYLYDQGLRGPICNGCKLAQLKYELGERFLFVLGAGIYEIGAEPLAGQEFPVEWVDQPIQFKWWGMSYEHSDECYHWSPPAKGGQEG